MSIVQRYVNQKGEFVRKDSQFRNFVTGMFIDDFILIRSFSLRSDN